MDNKEKALLAHKEWNGKLDTVAKSKVNSREDLAIAYTPGVAVPFLVSETSDHMPPCRLWKENACFSKNSEM